MLPRLAATARAAVRGGVAEFGGGAGARLRGDVAHPGATSGAGHQPRPKYQVPCWLGTTPSFTRSAQPSAGASRKLRGYSIPPTLKRCSWLQNSAQLVGCAAVPP